jgi:cyclophilin family peptidyl-prolyl cis-trans isomerase
MKRTSPLCALIFLGSLVPAFAANVAPELYQPLPALTLASGATANPVTLTNHLRDPDVPGSAVQLTVRLGTQTANLYLSLYDATTPLTVANFKAYITSGAFSSNFFHRAIPGFILQSGGFKLNGNNLAYVPTFPPILNEPGISNTRGTIAMAKVGPAEGQLPSPATINSATSGWFINLADNSSNLDSQNGGFTVFGRVLGNGMTGIVDILASVPTYDLSYNPANPVFDFPWTDIPLSGDPFLDNALYISYLIESTAALIPPLAYQVSSDNPALVTATVTNGILQLTGSASSAGQTTLRITTTDLEGGTLASTIPVTVLSSDPLIAWRQTNFSTTADTSTAANLADPDADGIINLLEYALGLSPTTPSTTGLPSAQVAAGTLSFTYKRAVATGLTYAVQTTTDLTNPASWTPTGVTQGTPDVNGNTTATIPYSTGPRYLRLSVTLNP